ncbi:MAG: 1-deoxy-D-xylulose-5-phosphate reductoisomerase [Candidatus Marinimicrobia bacterium]|nr:1-deoxy-D-xylulose-5-phosphate reductoisomerase [Candidatus Neomarinimicrobiota bacterium]
MKKILTILGSTGSIGVNALNVVRSLESKFQVRYLAAGTQWEKLAQQALEFGVKAVAIVDENLKEELKNAVGKEIEVLTGREGVAELAGRDDADILLNGIVGSAGLEPTVRAAEAGRIIALSNKESLVMGGLLINRIMERTGAQLYPVDSEHSAIWQCLTGEKMESVKKLILTASGGPFRTKPINEFENISVKEALAHPNWKMGKKVTIDSATLMNKGLEVIEAYWLFNIPHERIDIVIHPQSIIHSMVEFKDGSIKAQLGLPDMKLPIQYALTYPEREDVAWEQTDMREVKTLTFEEPDFKRFPCPALAFKALEMGGSAPAVLNVANESAVNLFLEEKIKFTDIAIAIDKVLQSVEIINEPSFEELLEIETNITELVRDEWT